MVCVAELGEGGAGRRKAALSLSEGLSESSQGSFLGKTLFLPTQLKM